MQLLQNNIAMQKKRIYMEVVELNFSFGWPVMSQLIF